MKTSRIMHLFLLIAVLVAAGCAQTAKNRIAQAESQLTAVRDTTVSLVRAGLIDDEDFVAADQYERAAQDALDRLKARFAAGEKPDLNFYLDLVEAMVLRIAELQARQLNE